MGACAGLGYTTSALPGFFSQFTYVSPCQPMGFLSVSQDCPSHNHPCDIPTPSYGVKQLQCSTKYLHQLLYALLLLLPLRGLPACFMSCGGNVVMKEVLSSALQNDSGVFSRTSLAQHCLF